MTTARGNHPLQNALSQQIQLGHLSIYRIRPRIDGLTPFIQISFNRDIRGIDKLQPYIEIDADSRPRIRREDSHTITIRSEEFTFGDTVNVTVREGLRAGLYKLERRYERTLTIPDPNPYVEIQSRGVFQSASGQKVLPVQYVNTDTLYVTTHQIYPDNLVYFANQSRYKPEQEELFQRRTRRVYKLPGRRNRIETKHLNLNDLVGGRLHGPKILQFNYPGSHHLNDQLLVVSDLGITYKQIGDQVLVLVSSLASGEPVSGARVYLGRSAENLTVPQAALLAGIPKSPNRFHPLRHPDRARARRNVVLRRMMEEGMISESRYRSARAEPRGVRRHRLPFQAPHVSEYLRMQGATGTIRTTIDLSVQKRVEALARTHMSSLRDRGVYNLSALVLNNQTGGVLAYLGSQDFFDDRHGGQIQGPFAVRSPGSTLKPFLYLQAFEEGRLAPAMSLPDVPVHYVGMEPENYDRQFEGIVTARRALKESLNVPAVRLPNRTGLSRFHSTLRELGFAHLKRDSHYYGLGLVLGGCGVTLWNLTAAYSTLARGGTYLAPTFLYNRARTRTPARRLFTRESSFLVNNILRDRDRPKGGNSFAYKTGTSSEHRDAWMIAFTPEFTVGVWTGNFSNESARVLLGRRTALPLARRILRTLHGGRNSVPFKKPPGVEQRRVCSVSGRLATPLCPHTADGLWIRGRTQNQRCFVHQHITVSPDGSRRYCSGCVRGHDQEIRVVETFSPLVQQFFRRRGMNRYDIPPHNRQCPYHRTNRFDLKIVQPVDGASFVDRDGTRLPIRVAGADGNRDVFVFVDDRYLGELSTDGTLFYEPEPGRHEVVAVDRTGRAVTHRFRVR